MNDIHFLVVKDNTFSLPLSPQTVDELLLIVKYLQDKNLSHYALNVHRMINTLRVAPQHAATTEQVETLSITVDRLISAMRSIHEELPIVTDGMQDETAKAFVITQLRFIHAILDKTLNSPEAGAKSKMMRDNDRLRSVVKHCAEIFRHYEDLHRSKSPADHQKADINATHAFACETALR